MTEAGNAWVSEERESPGGWRTSPPVHHRHLRTPVLRKGSWWGPKGSSQVEGKEARRGGPGGGEARHQAQLLPLAWSHWLAPLICSLGSEGQTGIKHEEKSGEKQADLGPSPNPDTSPLRLWANRVTCLNPIFLLGPHGKGTPLHLLPGLLGGSAERTLRTHLQNMNLRV